MKLALLPVFVQAALACQNRPGGKHASLCGKPRDELLMRPRNANENWEQKWRVVYNTESKTGRFLCDGVAAYGQGYNDDHWHVAGIYSGGRWSKAGTCDWQGFPFNEPVDHITAAGFSDKGCYCQTLTCHDGQPVWWSFADKMPFCKEHSPAIPTHLKVCMDLIFGTDGKEDCGYTHSESMEIGSTSSSWIHKDHKRSITADVNLQVSSNEIFEKMDMSASVKTQFDSAMESSMSQSTNELTKKSFSMYLACDKPAYWYRVRSVIYTEGGGSGSDIGTIDLLGDSQMVLSHPAPPCVTVDVHAQTVVAEEEPITDIEKVNPPTTEANSSTGHDFHEAVMV